MESLDSFLADMILNVNKFKEFWNEGQKSSGLDAFPEQLPPGDWYEQFLAFMNMERPE